MAYNTQWIDFNAILIFVLQTTIAYLKDGVNDEGVKTFDSLQWGREYCVSLKVESSTGPSMSNVSTPQCIFLPGQGEKNIIIMTDSGI